MSHKYKSLTVEQLKLEHQIYSEIIKSRHSKGLESKFEKRTREELASELAIRKR